MENTQAIRQVESQAIKHALQDARREGLTQLMGDFILLLQQEGFTFEDLLDALATWADVQPNLSGVVSKVRSCDGGGSPSL